MLYNYKHYGCNVNTTELFSCILMKYIQNELIHELIHTFHLFEKSQGFCLSVDQDQTTAITGTQLHSICRKQFFSREVDTIAP